MAKNKFFQTNDETENSSDIYNFERGITSKEKKDTKTSEQQNQNDYSDIIPVKPGPGAEHLYDRNNPFVRVFLFVFGLILAVVTILYIYIYATTM